MTNYPHGMPDTGERVDADPANFLRDVFLVNRGRIPARLVDNMIGRHSFTYGPSLVEAWEGLIADGYAVRDGDDWAWPIQEAMRRDPDPEPTVFVRVNSHRAGAKLKRLVGGDLDWYFTMRDGGCLVRLPARLLAEARTIPCITLARPKGTPMRCWPSSVVDRTA